MEHPYFMNFYCAGEFCDSDTKLEVRNPYDSSLIGITSYAYQTHLEKAILKAQQVSGELTKMPSFMKYEILSQISRELASLRLQFAELITLESGKPIRNALAEVDRSVQTFAVAAEESKRLPGETMTLDWTPAGIGKTGILKYFPIGLVAGITPFNFPLNLAVHKIAPAIAAGCPIILKPSSLTPLSTLMLSKIIDATALPKGAVSIIPMNRQTGNKLVTDERFKLLSFTGSPVVGRQMKREAGKKKVILELGGNAGVIISQGTDLQQAANKCVAGGFSYSGQVCIHTQRIYVLSELFDEFVQHFITGTKELKFGNPLDYTTDLAPMIDEANAIRVEQWVKEAVDQGAQLLTGGKRVKNIIQPTILTGTSEEMLVCSQEVFGPVVVIEPVTSFENAVDRINAGNFGLQAGVFTNSITEMDFAFNTLEVGGVIMNDTPTFRVDHMPYGGVKDSGQGREGVKYAIHDMLEPRLLVK